MIDAALRQKLPTGDGQDVAHEVTRLILAGITGRPAFPPYIAQQLVGDIEARVASGEKKYGTRLKTNNGRNVVLDAYQEILDFLNYSIQGHLEGKPGFLELFEETIGIAIRVKVMLLAQEYPQECVPVENAAPQSL